MIFKERRPRGLEGELRRLRTAAASLCARDLVASMATFARHPELHHAKLAEMRYEGDRPVQTGEACRRADRTVHRSDRRCTGFASRHEDQDRRGVVCGVV